MVHDHAEERIGAAGLFFQGLRNGHQALGTVSYTHLDVYKRQTKDEVIHKIAALHESNPMMGHRGCRLAVTYPEIAAMQTRAVIKAALNVSAETGHVITPHITIPLVGEVKELKFVKDVVVKVADELIAAAGVDMKYQVGTMIEIPRAALTAGEIAILSFVYSCNKHYPLSCF